MLFSSPYSIQDIPQPSAQQAHTCISTYMGRVEPALQLFAPIQARQAFLAGGMGMWATGEVPNQRGWLACYLAALAHGAMSMTKEEWHLSGRFDAREATAREWLLEAGRVLTIECASASAHQLLAPPSLIIRLSQTSRASQRSQVSCLYASAPAPTRADLLNRDLQVFAPASSSSSTTCSASEDHPTSRPLSPSSPSSSGRRVSSTFTTSRRRRVLSPTRRGHCGPRSTSLTCACD